MQRHHVVEEFDVLRRERNLESLEVGVEVLDLAPPNDGEDVREFLHGPGDGDCEAASVKTLRK